MTGTPSGQGTRLAEIVTRNRPRFLGFLRSRLSRFAEGEAEDVLGDVVLRLFEQADLLTQVEDLTAYLFRALANGVVDLTRRAGRFEPLTDALADEKPDPETAAERAELRRRLDKALAHLSPEERELWLAVEVEGKTFRELAASSDVPIGTLLSRKSRAAKNLRRHLREDGPPDDGAKPGAS